MVKKLIEPLCTFADFFTGIIYSFPVELAAPANGCGFPSPLK